VSVTNYYAVNGVVLGESGPNGIVNYHTDALGSVTMTSDQNGNIQNQYRYSPDGAQNYFDGSFQVPRFLWVGSLGYRHTGNVHSNTYVRARHYGYPEGMWTTVDRDFPREPPYNYALSNAIRYTDTTGNGGVFYCTTWKVWADVDCDRTNAVTGVPDGKPLKFNYCAGSDNCHCSTNICQFCFLLATVDGTAFGVGTRLLASFSKADVSTGGTAPPCDIYHRQQEAFSAIPVIGSFLGASSLLQDAVNVITAFQSIAPWGKPGDKTSCTIKLTISAKIAYYCSYCNTEGCSSTCNKSTPGFPGIAGKRLNALGCSNYVK
jgi:hypothetical protein